MSHSFASTAEKTTTANETEKTSVSGKTADKAGKKVPGKARSKATKALPGAKAKDTAKGKKDEAAVAPVSAPAKEKAKDKTAAAPSDDYDPWLDDDAYAAPAAAESAEGSTKAQAGDDETSASRREDERIFSPSYGFNRIANTRRGYLLFNSNDDVVGRSLDLLGEYGEPSLHVLNQMIRPGQVVVDIGAHFGVMAVAFAEMVGARGRVLAYEPQRVLFQTLCANVALNSLEQVDTFQLALSDKPGTTVFPEIDFRQPANYGAISIGQYPEGMPVDVKTFDEHFFYPQLHLMKISAPGMEANLLKGAKQAIARFQPLIYVDCERPSHAPELISTLQDMNYRAWWHVFSVFSPGNYYLHPEDPFPGTVFVRLIAAHKATGFNVGELPEVMSSEEFPSFQPQG